MSVAIAILVVTPLALVSGILLAMHTSPTTWSVGRDLIGTNKERWKELCEQAANEQDPANLAELVKEINDLLDARRLRLIQPSDTPEDRNGAST